MFEDGALSFWLALLGRMAITAIIVVVASFVAERSGPFLGALSASLPLPVSGAYIILALEHDADYVVASTIGSLAATVVNAGYGVTYSMLAQRHGLLLSVSGAFIFWLAGSMLMSLIHWTIGPLLLFNVLVTPIALYLSRNYRTATAPQVTGAIRRADIFLRAATVAGFIAIVTIINYRIGSFAAGMFSVFPAIMTSLVIILHPRIGGKATASVMAHLQATVPGVTLGILAIYLTAQVAGVWWALTVGFVTCMSWSAALLAIEQFAYRRRQTI